MDDEERLEGDEEMELDEASDGDDDDDETSGLPVSPANSDQLMGTTPTPGNVTPDEAFHDPLPYQKFPLPGGKPLNIRRGPGRPRKERPPGYTRGGGTRRPFGRGSTRGKGLGYSRGMPRRTKSKDDDTHSESQSPLRLGDDQSGDGESSSVDRSMPAPEEPPYFPEQWPGKVCAFCNLGERSQLGQGELVRLSCPEGFVPEKSINRDETTELSLVDVSSTGDKSPRAAGPGAVTCRRQKSLAKCRNPSLSNFTEPVEELTIVGYLEEPEVGILFESSGHYHVHQSCAVWTSNNQELLTEVLSQAVLQASSRRCAYCSHYGAGIPCKVGSCNRFFHLPCAAASSSFQDTKTLSLFCSQHLGQVPLLLNGDVTCMHCYGMGDVSNLVMCSLCGQHYHGSCVGLALLPGVRAGWQCNTCRICQVCRQPEEVSKVMLCEQCDKAYHPGCLRPIVTSIPKFGWKCKCCRVCTDCGSRTPGAGLSSRWHSHYTVCDSCYQQRNKGFSCPLCRKAYRAAAYREMVQCSSCKKFVHGTCDPDADPATYQHRKETKPDYEYVCITCKSTALTKRKDNVDDYGGDSSLTASQESLYGDGDSSEFDYPGGSEDSLFSIGLGKGKPFCASKIAKKRLGLGGSGVVGRPKGVGKLGYQKRQKMNEFGRKRGPKAKMRGIFGVPGVGLQRPISDSFSKEDEPGVENRLVLCSAKDKFVLTQDICVMCGAIGTDQEGCLIACAQCGQCYHPYCANVKVTKVILQKGWRCLDCTVCEGCGERNDEGRLILCDDCDISYHIYCMDPPLDYVPHGTWKCKWCAQCQTCGSNDPGFNSSWQKNYTQCGPCASHTACTSCQETYNEGDLIIQCIQCERWLHCACDHIKNEADAEKCAEEGYNCILCRPRDVPPPHIACNLPKPQPKFAVRSPPPPPTIPSPELYKPAPQQYLIDGVYLSEAGMCHIKSLTFEQQQTRKKRRKLLPPVDKEADIMATIESVVAGGSLDNSLEENGGKLDLLDVKDEAGCEILKEGMVWAPRGDQPPPDGFSIYTTENGVPVLRRKRQRNLQKLGIGGFLVRIRGTRKDKDDEIVESETKPSIEGASLAINEEKPRRKVQRRKPKTKLSECYPQYMQEAFFGKDLMDTTKDKDIKSSSDSEDEKNFSATADTIQLSQDELKAIEQVKNKGEIENENDDEKLPNETNIKREDVMEDEGSDTEALDDILPMASDLLDNDLVNTIMNEQGEDLAKASEALEELDDTPGPSKDELTDILSPHFNLESMVRDTGLPNMDSKDVEEIFKGVLTDESQESQESSAFPIQSQAPHTPAVTTPLVSPSPHPAMPSGVPLGRPQVPGSLPSVGQSNLNSPMSFPPPSPYHSEYSNSPQFSPAFSEPPSPWVNPDDETSGASGGTAISYNQRSNLKMEADEALGTNATISSVLYANINHPEWKSEYPAWSDRCKQILKKWRALPNDKRAPYLTQARDNRAAIRIKKTQPIPKDIPSTTQVTATSSPTITTKPVTAMTSAQVTPVLSMSVGQKQIGLLASVQGTDKSIQEKTGMMTGTPCPSGLTSALTTGVATIGGHLAEEQDRLSNRDRSSREAEQERQWKQLQAQRQQQAQHQQQSIHEQRVHGRPFTDCTVVGAPKSTATVVKAIARVHRQISDDGTSQLNPENQAGLTTQLQVSTSQDGNLMVPLASPSPGSRGTFAAPSMKVTRGVAPPSPLQSIPRLPNQQQCGIVQRPVGAAVRPGIPNTFAQPPSPFSPQAPQSPHDFPQSPASSQSQQEHFQRFDSGNNETYPPSGSQTPRSMLSGTTTYSTSPRNDVFSQPPGTPRPVFNPPTPRSSTHVYAPSRTPDPYSNQPSTPSPAPSYTSPRPESRQDPPPAAEAFNQQPEVNLQLRDLLQRQQLTKKIDPLAQTWTQDGQNPGESGQQQFEPNHVQLVQHIQPPGNPVEGTFRHPLPPGIGRPRMPIPGIQPNSHIRTTLGLNSRHPGAGNIDPRLQGIDPRTRMLYQRPPVSVGMPQQQQQQQQQQHFQNQQVMQQRMASPRNSLTEQYDILHQQRFPDSNQGASIAQRIVRGGPEIANQNVRMMSSQGMVRPPLIPQPVTDNNSAASEASEIPDNVTAELEKLEQEGAPMVEVEQEGAPMVEVEGVSAILGDLGDDDDELLAEMGADFNILEYADPELDNITGGEKTNILDLDLEQVEVETKDDNKQKKETKEEEVKSEELGSSTASHSDMNGPNMQNSAPPPPEASNMPQAQAQTMTPVQTPTSQPQQQQQAPILAQNHPQAVAVQQQMHHHVQQAAAMGRPMPPGTRLLSPDGAIGVVTSTNTVTVSYPATFPGHPQRIPPPHMQVPQQQRMGMRVAGIQGVAGRVVAVNHMIGSRTPLAPPPPPPPYPGPPPPYPGPIQEQPLLLEDLLEQEKREQEKQQQQQQQHVDTSTPSGALLSDSEFERLRADVLGSAPLGSPPQGIPSGVPVIRPPCTPRPPSAPGSNWSQPVPDTSKLVGQSPRQPMATQTPPEPRIATFNVPQLPAPPAPPETIVTEQDRQMQLQYEQWLNHQHQILSQQLKHYETEVQKLRKIRKSLNSKQRQLRKSGNELTDNDAAELQRISTEQAVLQKQLDASRKQTRQHGMLIQEYRSKQQQRQPQSQSSEPCSPLMSPSQHSSPMHSPAGLVSHSPGPGSVPPNMIQHSPVTSTMIQHSPNPPLLQHSPGNPQSANPGTMSPQSMLASPRIGTPHSQGDESPFSPGAMPSPGICGPTATRMASPQHRAVIGNRLATSPGAFAPEIRSSQQMIGDQNVRLHNLPQRFGRPPALVDSGGQRPRMQLQGGIVYGQRSPLGSPQAVQQSPMLTQQQHQALLQRQQIIQQQHEVGTVDNQAVLNQRTLQMVQARQQLLAQQQQAQQQLAQQQQQQQQQQQAIAQQQRQQFLQMQQQQQQQQQQQLMMQKPPNSPMVSQPANSPSPQLHQQQIQQANYGQPPSSPMPRSPMVQQQTMGSPMLQQQLSQSSQPPSPMNGRMHHPPNSPMVTAQYQSPLSPMSRSHPSTSPMLQHQLNNINHPPQSQTPSSPMPRSPMVGGSPMQIQRRTSSGNSPAMPDRPLSVENPGTPRTPHTPHASHAYGPQNSGNQVNEQQQEQNSTPTASNPPTTSLDHSNRGGGNPHNPLNTMPMIPNFGRFGFIKLGLRGGSPMWSTKAESSKGKTAESHVNSSEEKPNTSTVVHRKTGISQSKINSLVCADYNDFDDDSHTPPQTPPTTLEPKSVTGTSSLADAPALPIENSIEKIETIPDTTDYDDDKTIVNEEVTLSSTAQRDTDDITVIEEFGDSELVDVISGTLEGDMQEEYVLFEPDMVDLSVDSNDSLSNALVNNTNEAHDLVQILEIQHSDARIDDHSLSDDEMPQGRNKKSLRLDIARSLPSGKRLIAVTDTPDSPDQEELLGDTSPGCFMNHSPDHELMVSLVSHSEVVIIDQRTKSPDEHRSKESYVEDEIEKSDMQENSSTARSNELASLGKSCDNAQRETIESIDEERDENKPGMIAGTGKIRHNEISSSSLHHAESESLRMVKSAMSKDLTSAMTAVMSAMTTATISITAATTSTAITTSDTITSSVDTIDKMAKSGSSIAVNRAKEIVIPMIVESSDENLTMSQNIESIVADAKIAAKLTLLESTLTNTKITNSIDVTSSRVEAIASKTTDDSSVVQLLLNEEASPTGTIVNEFSKTFSNKAGAQESSNSQAKLSIVVQPTSVTSIKPKMSVAELPKKSEAVLKSEKLNSTETAKGLSSENMRETMDEEKTTAIEVPKIMALTNHLSDQENECSRSIVQDDRKCDSLNTTDELESMLEAIHNPAENAMRCEKTIGEKTKSDVSSIKRMSPVSDDLSLVNILENDVEPVMMNETKARNERCLENVGITKTKERNSPVMDLSDSGVASPKINCDDKKMDTEKSYNDDEDDDDDEKNLMDESSDDILDMLHNIISSKPEMANSDILQEDRSRKSSMIYDLAAPLDTLPLNILQDSLMDLEQETAEAEHQAINQTERKCPKIQKSFVLENTRKSPSISQPSSTQIVSTTAQLQKTSTTTTVPHLSPISKPTELTSNVANVSHQLRTLLSSLQTNNSQNYTTSSQNSLITMVSTAFTSSKMASVTTVSSTKSSSLSNNSSNTSFRSQTPTPTLVNVTPTSSASLNIVTSLTGKSPVSEHYPIGNLQSTSSAVSSSNTPISRNSGTCGISITSNAMLNAMLAGTNSANPSIGGHRGNTVLTQTSNLLSSVMPTPSIQRGQNLQSMLQAGTGGSSLQSRIMGNSTSLSTAVTTTTPATTPSSSPLQSSRTTVPSVTGNNVVNTVNVTTSILQSTLSQASTLLHTQLTSGTTQYKSTGLLPIDNKSNDHEAHVAPSTAGIASSTQRENDTGVAKTFTSAEKQIVGTTRAENEIGKISLSNSHKIEESQNVLLKQLLQNTACATIGTSSSASQGGPSLPLVPSLEAQLARPVPPTPSSLLPPILNETTTTKTPTSTKQQILTRETSFVSQSVLPSKTQSPPVKEETTTRSAVTATTSPTPQTSTTTTSVAAASATTTAAASTTTTSSSSTSANQTTPHTQRNLDSTGKTQTATLQQNRSEVLPVATGPSSVGTVKAATAVSLTTKIAESLATTDNASAKSQAAVKCENLMANTSQGRQQMQQQQQQRISTSVATSYPRLSVPQGKPTVAPIATTKVVQPISQAPSNAQLSTSSGIPASGSTATTATSVQTPQPQISQIHQQQQTIQKSSILQQSQQHQIQQHQQQQQQQQQQHHQIANTIQPSVPHTIAQSMGHEARLPQGAISQNTVPLVEVKKEILDEVLSVNNPTQLSDTKDFLTAKEELIDGSIDDKTDIKKLKRRQYQQKRRQSQGKDATAPTQKKRSRKVSRMDEDYDTFIDNLMIQLRQLPPMSVLEPLLGRNYGVCPIFGSGDLAKIGTQKDYNTRTGDLTGVYGAATLLGISDHYNTQPFGELEPSTPQQPASTQRGFYDQEFPPLKLDDFDRKENSLSMSRDADTPDTIVSSSSPECVIPECVHKFPGLRLIDEESDEETDWLKRVSPVIPIVSPIPIRLKPGYLKDAAKQDKENLGSSRMGKSPPLALRDTGNVTVTLTLNSQAADDIMGVLKDLANILNIATPPGYQIVERTTTPPSQKLGLYRTKGKDGKEGAPIDIQSILNGAAKFCRHCDVVILSSLIRKKVSDLPFLSKDEGEPGDELCFCSAACYMQFALMHRTPTNTQGMAATIVDHLCQKAEAKLLDDTLKKKVLETKVPEKKEPEDIIDHPEDTDMDISTEIKIKTETEDLDMNEMAEDMQIDEKRPKKHPASEENDSEGTEPPPPTKVWRGLRYKTWSLGAIQPPNKYKKPTDREVTEMLFRMGVTVVPAKTEDSRRCMFCQSQGDGAADGPARLLNFDVDKWVHLNCALWSEDVYETVNGALMNLDTALQHSLVLNCIVCEKPGATVKCFKMRCTNVYHLGCAVKDGCVFYKNKSTYCSQHIQKNEKDNELTTLSVYRRVYVNRDENRQVAAVMHHSEHNHLLRVGSLIFLSVGQLLPHQLVNFHTPNYIYPVGYKIVRFYWSMRRPNKRCRYVCSIHDVSGRPEFRVLVQEPAQEDMELRDATPRAVWSRILEPLAELRRTTHTVQLFPRYVSGEDLFGLTEPAVVRVLESLPGIETLTDYRFKYGRNPLLELPLAINPTGSARTEARLRNQLPWKRPHTQRTASSARATFVPTASIAGEVACPYSKQFVHSKSSQYKKMKQEWRNNVYLARSKIQGLGLYAARDLEKHTMVIEYIGEIIRTELAETREKQYEARNRGIYMFRLDEERVVDATLSGGLARYINHSCNPNCVAEIVEVERDLRIIIFAKRRISRGEELAYDYKFDIEDDQHKIACACAAPNCRKWMN